MIAGQRVIVVMPAYNAAKTLKITWEEIPREFVDDVILVDDGSCDDTVSLSKELGITTVIHNRNRGYGANQKTCYDLALQMGADIVVMLHPDYQYPPKLIPAMVSMIAYGPYDVVLASRILVGSALRGGMPLYKYILNRISTAFQNVLWKTKLSEFHTGYRAFRTKVLWHIPYRYNSDGFIFDNQIIAQVMRWNYRIGELSCPASYTKDSSSINFFSSIVYGLGILKTTLFLLLARSGIYIARFLKESS